MAEAKLGILITIKNNAQKGLESLNKQLVATQKEAEKTKEAWNAIGKAGAVMGAAIVGAFGMMAKAAEGDRQSSAKLAQMLKNVGVAYDDVKDSLEANIKATARKTGIADEQQREALSQLIMVTGSYEKSLEALPAVLDLAAARGMDVSSAAVAMGRALNGDTAILKRYGVALEDGADATEVLAAITKSCGGAAESMASPFAILKNEIDEMGESIGSLLLPVLSGLVQSITTVIGWVSGFIDRSGVLGQVLAGVVVTVGILALAVAAYAAATQSATIAMVAHIIQLGLAAAAKVAATIATVGLTAAVSTYAASLWAAVAAQAALLAPLALVVGALAAVGAAVYGVYRGMNWLISAMDDSSGAMNILEYNAAALKEEMGFLQTSFDDTKTKIGEEQTKLQELQSDLQYTKTYMVDAFGIERVDEIERLKSVLESQQTTIENLEGAIESAKRELQGLMNPSLEGMNAADDELFSINQRIKNLQLQKLQMEIGADTTEIDAAIAKEQRAYDVAALTRDITFDPLVRQINTAAEAALGMSEEMAPEDVLARIQQLSTDIQTNETRLAGVQKAAGQTNQMLSALQKMVQANVDITNAKIATQERLIYNLQVAARNYKARLDDITAEWQQAERAARDYQQYVISQSLTSDDVTVTPPAPYVIPGMASGGIVTRPTNAIIGEAGPEAVIPLRNGGLGGNTYSVSISAGAFVGDRAGADAFADMIMDSLRAKQRYSYGAAQF